MGILKLLDKVISQSQIKERYGKYLPLLKQQFGCSEVLSGYDKQVFRISDLATQVKKLQKQREAIDEVLRFYEQIMESELMNEEPSLPEWALKMDYSKSNYNKGVYLGYYEGYRLYAWTNIVLIVNDERRRWVFRNEVSVSSPAPFVEAERRAKEAYLLPWVEELEEAYVIGSENPNYAYPNKYAIPDYSEERSFYIGELEENSVKYDLWIVKYGYDFYYVKAGENSCDYLNTDYSRYPDLVERFGTEVYESMKDKYHSSVQLREKY